MSKKIRVETHLHTDNSKDGKIKSADILSALEKGLSDKVFITDHDETENALALARDFPGIIYPGEEVYTLSGELILLFIKEKIPGGLDLETTVRLAKDQGCFISIPHPFDRFRNSRIRKELPLALKLADALEVFNSRCLFPADNEKARLCAEKRGLLFTAGSDAHVPVEIGTSGLLMPDFSDVQTFRNSLEKAEVFGKLSPFFVHALSSFEKWRKKSRF